MNTDDDLKFHRLSRKLPQIKTNIAPNRCEWPWKEIHIDRKGRIFLCGCDAWVPFSVGHIMDFDNIDDIFKTATAKKIQTAIKTGTYEYCDTTNCGVASEVKTIPYDYEIQIGIDDSCNLQCPSCRREFIFRDNAEYLDERQLWVDQVGNWIAQKHNAKINILIGSNGEPFASPLYLHFLKNQFASNVHYEIRTNGTLIKKHIDNLSVLPNLKIIKLSLDAATPKTYEIVRKPGKWNSLIENIEYINQLKKTYGFKIYASFVIQKNNIDDILPFVDFCQKYQFESCDFTLIQDWGSFENFDSQCVHLPTHELHLKFREIIKDPRIQKLSPHWLANY